MISTVASLEAKIADLPQDINEKYVVEISQYIDYILYLCNQEREDVSDIVVEDKELYSNEEERQAVIAQTFGMWANHDNSVSVDATVRQMRRRRFDI